MCSLGEVYEEVFGNTYSDKKDKFVAFLEDPKQFHEKTVKHCCVEDHKKKIYKGWVRSIKFTKTKGWRMHVIYANDQDQFEEPEYQLEFSQLLTDYLQNDFEVMEED